MIILFTSRSEQKSHKLEREILDAFADRIGKDTWQAIMTEKGLQAVRGMLAAKATKNMSVACYKLNKSYRKLLWIIGNRELFNDDGITCIGTTAKRVLVKEEEEDDMVTALQPLLAVAGLLHDVGKANDRFQNKLKGKVSNIDPIRHEYVSCLILKSVYKFSSDKTDEGILRTLLDIKTQQIIANLSFDVKSSNQIFRDLPPVTKLLCWLILSHHKLPVLKELIEGMQLEKFTKFDDVLDNIDQNYGYCNYGISNINMCNDDLVANLSFTEGIMFDNDVFKRKLNRWCIRLIKTLPKLKEIMNKSSFRLAILYVRMSLVLSDHHISSCTHSTKKVFENMTLVANTKKNKNGIREIDQFLSEHVIRVSDEAVSIFYNLKKYQNMRKLYDVQMPVSKPKGKFYWQEKAEKSILDFKSQHSDKNYGAFIVNMASTGCGKTISNAKNMRALSKDGSLRYILALGLRSLTLQTGDEYKKSLGMTQDDLAVVIGSSNIQKLHDSEMDDIDDSLMLEDVFHTDEVYDRYMDIFIDTSVKNSKKNLAFLTKPVLVATIDHIMMATECIKGGRFILPFMRLMSSDLIIDEIDDFGRNDLIAISRLVHLAGMLGRNVSISSATIPPDLAAAMFKAYSSGYKIYSEYYKKDNYIAAFLCDEYNSSAYIINNDDSNYSLAKYQEKHNKFVAKRATLLMKEKVKRKAYIKWDASADYVTNMVSDIIKLHDTNNFHDKITGKCVSFGMIRTANVNMCIDVTRYLLEQYETPSNYEIRVMAYHSRQVMILRYIQEAYLDRALKRKGDYERIEEPVIRETLDKSDENNIIFVLVVTPVEEVGRDHDFDWAIVEPSSIRSLIQLAGRVLRHREKDSDAANIAIMQHNHNEFVKKHKLVFCNPGFEDCPEYHLDCHDVMKLIEKDTIENINSLPRIIKPSKLKYKENLVHLEHKVMMDILNNNDVFYTMTNWLESYIFMTGLHQKKIKFRANTIKEIELYYEIVKSQAGKYYFYLYDGDKKIPFENVEFENVSTERLWLNRDMDSSVKYVEEKLGKEGFISREYFQVKAIQYKNLENERYLYSDELGIQRITQKK